MPIPLATNRSLTDTVLWAWDKEDLEASGEELFQTEEKTAGKAFLKDVACNYCAMILIQSILCFYVIN